jgi:DNA polymerase III subunit alpha
MLPIPLRVHSHWSLLDGVPSIAELIAHAQTFGLPALALTDTNAVYAVTDFVRECRTANLRPIIGAELSFLGDAPIILLAQNNLGYANLYRLITRLQASPQRKSVLAHGLSLDDLTAHHAGLIALWPGCADPSRFATTAHDLRDLFDDERFYLAISDPAEAAVGLIALADQWRVPIVAAPDVRYLASDDASRAVYHTLTAMRLGRCVTDVPPLPDRSFVSPDDLRRRFAAYPIALANTNQIAERCRFDLPLGQLHFPAMDLPAGRTPRDELRSLAWTGAQQRYGAITPAIEARLLKETGVIDALGFAPYFLVVADIVRYARERHVPISPRGSASSSVVAYCLGIHDVDPIVHDLYFERFLSLERHDPPDIDLDLCSRRRDEVIDYVYRRFGAEHVAMVCTFATLQPRSALREVAKVYGLTQKRIRELSEHLPRWWHPAHRREAQEAQAALLDAARNPIEREVIALSQRLTGFPHHLSVHPGGIVIAPGPITDRVPLQYAAKGLLVTQFDLHGIEAAGLIKIDLLGISALTVVADCVELIQRAQPDFTLDSIPRDDAATRETLSSAQTIGCFQIESPGLRFTLRELSAQTTSDLIVALALYRPGPLKGGLKDALVRRHLKQEPTTYLHPALEPILRETYGVILYQEQVLRIAHETAGFTLGQADILRRAMSKFRSAHEMDQLRVKFIDGARDASGMDQAIAQQVWDMMAAFAGYGFPKAHAAGYAAVAYRMAYLKTHYPAEFMAARLAVWGGYYSPRVYLAEARQLGLRVQPPHVNHSAEVCTLDPDRRTVWMGLGQVRELTRVTMGSILQHRPFRSLDDFLARVRPLHLEALNLIKVNALAGLGDQAALLDRIEREPWRGRHSAQLSLLSASRPITSRTISQADRLKWEQDLLGYAVSVQPLDVLADRLSKEGVVPSRAIESHLDRAIVLAGSRLALHHLKSATGEPMLLVDMADQFGRYQVLWGGAPLRQYRAIIDRREPVIVRGRVKPDRHGRPVVVGSAIEMMM